MKKIVIILSISLVLPIFAFAQTENDFEVTEFKLNEYYSVKISQISEREYIAKEKESEHLQHKPYEVITDIAKVQKLLDRRLKVFEIEEYAEYGNREYEITFKDGTKKRLEYYNYGFVAYFPQLEILLFEGGHSSDQPFDLNNSNYAITFGDNFPYHIRIGNPYYHSVSPDRQFRINGFHDGQDCLWRFWEKWNPLEKKYEFINYLWGENHQFDFCYSYGWFWTSNNKVLFRKYENYYEIEFKSDIDE